MDLPQRPGQNAFATDMVCSGRWPRAGGESCRSSRSRQVRSATDVLKRHRGLFCFLLLLSIINCFLSKFPFLLWKPSLTTYMWVTGAALKVFLSSSFLLLSISFARLDGLFPEKCQKIPVKMLFSWCCALQTCRQTGWCCSQWQCFTSLSSLLEYGRLESHAGRKRSAARTAVRLQWWEDGIWTPSSAFAPWQVNDEPHCWLLCCASFFREKKSVVHGDHSKDMNVKQMFVSHWLWKENGKKKPLWFQTKQQKNENKSSQALFQKTFPRSSVLCIAKSRSTNPTDFFAATWVGGGLILTSAEMVYSPKKGLIWAAGPMSCLFNLVLGKLDRFFYNFTP